MKLTHFGYNAFVIEGQQSTIILDPGQDLDWRRLDSLIPRFYWDLADLILVTHGDADHAEYVTQVALASGAPIVCGAALAKRWLARGLDVVPLSVGETVRTSGLEVQGLPAQHGGLALTLFGHALTLKPKFVGTGAVSLLFSLDNLRLLNLGDTLLIEDAWGGLRPDILMVPIGGMMTMDVDEALIAVKLIEPRIVIPMHYNWRILFYRRPTDVQQFAAQVRGLGATCCTLKPGETTELSP